MAEDIASLKCKSIPNKRKQGIILNALLDSFDSSETETKAKTLEFFRKLLDDSLKIPKAHPEVTQERRKRVEDLLAENEELKK
jgi:hypothetical protein